MSIRTQHVGKNPQEKEVYRNFLSSKFELDKTVEDSENLLQSDSSSLEENELKKEKVTPKSKWLKIKDFFDNKWIVAFISGIILLLLGGYVDLRVEQGVTSERISGIEKDIEHFETANTSQSELISGLSERLSVFKAEVQKDIEFIKERISLLNSN